MEDVRPPSSSAVINGSRLFAINNVSYLTSSTPLKLANLLANGTGVYQFDSFSVSSSEEEAVSDTNVASGMHNGWVEMVFQNDLSFMDAWHLDGFGFYTVGLMDLYWDLVTEWQAQDRVHRIGQHKPIRTEICIEDTILHKSFRGNEIRVP